MEKGNREVGEGECGSCSRGIRIEVREQKRKGCELDVARERKDRKGSESKGGNGWSDK